MNIRGNNLSTVKQHNLMLIKEIIYRKGPISRSEIAQSLGLTIPTITTTVNPMLADGMLKEHAIVQEDDAKLLGRRPTVLEVNYAAHCVMGIELGPYRTAYVITDMGGKSLYCEEKLRPTDNYQEMLLTLQRDIPVTLEKANIPSGKCIGIGVGIPGFVDGKTGKTFSSFRKDWNGRNLSADLSELQPIPVKVENNVRARAISADLFDNAVNKNPFAYYFVSYGLACPLIIGGTILYGEDAGAGEIGHMVVEMNGPKCDTCGNNGCLEALASEKAIIKRCRQIMTSGISTMLDRICTDPMKLNISDVILAQKCGDITINSIVTDSIKYLGVNLANIINLVSPGTVLIDGYIFSHAPNRESLLEIVSQNVFSNQNRRLDIDFIEYNPFLGARGAAAIAVKEFFLNSNSQLSK